MNYGEASFYEFIKNNVKRKLSNNFNFFLWRLVDVYYILPINVSFGMLDQIKLITNVDYLQLWFIYSAECNCLSGYPCCANTVRWCCKVRS